METVIRILMRRDGLTHKEAYEAVRECMDMIEECINNCSSAAAAYAEATDILQEELGLEPDYLEELML